MKKLKRAIYRISVWALRSTDMEVYERPEPNPVQQVRDGADRCDAAQLADAIDQIGESLLRRVLDGASAAEAVLLLNLAATTVRAGRRRP